MLIESVPGEPLSFHVIPFDNPRQQYTLEVEILPSPPFRQYANVVFPSVYLIRCATNSIDHIVVGDQTGQEFGTEEGMGSSTQTCHPGKLRRRDPSSRATAGPPVGSRAVQPGETV